MLWPEQRFFNARSRASNAMPATLDRIAELTRDNPDQRARIALLRPLVERQLGFSKTSGRWWAV